MAKTDDSDKQAKTAGNDAAATLALPVAAPIKTVPLWCEVPLVPGGPTTMDCHPDEVENMVRHGWRMAKKEK